MNFRPTLIIGLGGSGTFVVRRLKKRLQRVIQGDLPPSIQLLAFDTDIQKPVEMLETLKNQEFHQLSNFNGGDYVSESALARNPAISAFWKYNQLVPDWIRTGAAQLPPVGRLALFVRFDDVMTQLSDALTRMFQETADYMPPQDIGAVDVYVIGSACGGTGAGMFFDMALLARYEVSRMARRAILQAHVFLPSCFPPEALGPRIQANAWAFLKTMEVFESLSLPPIRYPSLQTPEFSSPLFSRVHAMSGVNSAGVRGGGLRNVYETTAMHLDLEIVGASARDMASAIDNCPPDFTGREGGRMAIYSSYGAELLSGSSVFGRLAVLPPFCSRVVQRIASGLSGSTDHPVVLSNEAFARVSSVFENEDAALELAQPDFGNEVNRLRNTENPVGAARGLVMRVDTIASTLSFAWLSKFDELGRSVTAEVTRIIEEGRGIPAASAYLDAAKTNLQRLTSAVEGIQSAVPESADQIVSRVDRFLQSRDKKKEILQQEGYAFLKTQTILRVRQAVARKVRPALNSVLGDLNRMLDALSRFDYSARMFVDRAETHAREALNKHTASVGPDAHPEETSAIRERFDHEAAEAVDRFLVSSSGKRALQDVAKALLRSDSADVWGEILLEAADDYLAASLAESVTLGSDWPKIAAEKILKCQPMIQFAPDYATSGRKRTTLVHARAYDSARVEAILKELAPGLKMTVEKSDEPGHLEVTSMALNFALHQVQEVRLLETAYRSFRDTRSEPTANRYAWRAPAQLWDAIDGVNLMPLSANEQALARVLALDPVPPMTPVATKTVGGFQIEGKTLDLDPDASWYGKFDAFNQELVGSGIAGRVLQAWRKGDPSQAREHFSKLLAGYAQRIALAGSSNTEQDGESYIAMLRQEQHALENELRRLPV